MCEDYDILKWLPIDRLCNQMTGAHHSMTDPRRYFPKTFWRWPSCSGFAARAFRKHRVFIYKLKSFHSTMNGTKIRFTTQHLCATHILHLSHLFAPVCTMGVTNRRTHSTRIPRPHRRVSEWDFIESKCNSRSVACFANVQFRNACANDEDDRASCGLRSDVISCARLRRVKTPRTTN